MVGISVGNSNSYVAACRGGGIEILLNEYSNRATPSMVAFTDHSRSIGVDAYSNFHMNLKNTVYDLMVLLGKRPDEIDALKYGFKIDKAEDGQTLVVVRHLGEERRFTITQVLAMMFTKLRGISEGVTDCVISCPQFYNDQQKANLISAATIAGLNPLQVISDMTAVVLNYAYYRTTKGDPDKFIAFINFGQSNLQTVVAWFRPRDDVVQILAAESESIGGKDFDQLLADHFVRENNLKLTPKAYLKLMSSCEKLKKLLSANTNEIPIHVESLISEDKDFTARIDRATFENLSQHLLERVQQCLKRTLESAKVNFDQTILDMAKAAEEAEKARAARKAAQAAKKAAQAAKKAEAAQAAAAAKAEASPAKSDVPMDPADPKNDATVATDNVDENQAADNASSPMSTDETCATEAGDKGESPMLAEEVSAKLAADKANSQPASEGAATTEDAAKKSPINGTKASSPNHAVKYDLSTVEVVGGSSRIPAIKQLVQEAFNLIPSTTLNTDEAVARGCALHCATLLPGMKVKREVRVLNSESFSKPGSFVCDKDSRRVELELIQSDLKYKSRTEARNTLEEFIYSERSKLEEGNPLLNDLSSTLDWLFSDEGEEAPETDYVQKLADLRKAIYNN